MNSPRKPFLVLSLCSLIACPVLLGGCRLCADCDLDAYPSYGGAWQRTVRDSGRVGSVFDPGGSRAANLSERFDAESSEAFNRSQNGQTPQDDDPDNDGESKENEDDVPLDDEERMKQMEDRLRGLELQDINHHEPQVDSQQWR